MRKWISVTTLPVYFTSSFFAAGLFVSGCGGGNNCDRNVKREIPCAYGSGGSGGGSGGGTSGRTSGGGTSGGTSGGGTSGGTGGGGTSGGGTSGGSGGSGSSGGSGGAVRAPGGPFLIRAKELVPPFRLPIQGLVNGGQSRAIAGARVYVLQVNSNPYTDSSISLLRDSAGNPPDTIGHYVLTSEYGAFSIAGRYTCTAGQQVYVYVRGGNSGGDGENSAIGLMTSLGSCPEAGNFDTVMPFIFVNEVSTIAAAYAMAESATDATHIGTRETDHGASATVNGGELASVATGFAFTELQSRPDTKIPKTKIHTLANILSACVNSSSPASGGCRILFANSRSNGGIGASPEDTATAAINIARNPHANVAALFSLQPKVSAPFTPALDSAPADFTLPIAPEKPGTDIAFSIAPK